VFDAAMTIASFDQLMWHGATWPCQAWSEREDGTCL
jgi:hypothetical protein